LVFPGDVKLEAAAGAEASDVACGPGAREEGQDVNLAGVALEEHLGDAGDGPEHRINIKGQGAIGVALGEEVGVAVAGDEAGQAFVCHILVEQACVAV